MVKIKNEENELYFSVKKLSLLACICSLIVGCGNKKTNAHYAPVYVDPSYADYYAIISKDLNTFSGQEMLGFGERGRIDVKPESIVSKATKIPESQGYFDGENIAISDTVTGSSRRFALGHELGHALGLQHTNSGIMSNQGKFFDVLFCLNREAECLYIALREQGVI